MRILSNKIYTSFIREGSPAQVNISATQRASIEKIVKDPNISTYSIAEAEIFKLLSKDPFPRFLKSDLIKTYEKNRVDNYKKA